MLIWQCMGSKFCVKFQWAPLKFHTKFGTHLLQNVNFTDLNFCVWLTISLNCDATSLSETGPRAAPCVDKAHYYSWDMRPSPLPYYSRHTPPWQTKSSGHYGLSLCQIINLFIWLYKSNYLKFPEFWEQHVTFWETKYSAFFKQRRCWQWCC